MGKTKLKIKESKKEIVTSENEVIKLVKIVGAVLVLFGLFYLITVLVKKEEPKKDSTPVEIQYEEILLATLLDQKEADYYVLAYEEKDKNLGTYSLYLSKYETVSNALKYYTVNINDGFNALFIDEEENLKVTDISKLKLNKTVLFRITKGKITETYSDPEKIDSYLAKIIK